MNLDEFERLLMSLDALITEFEGHQDREVSARVVELVHRVDAVHRAGLERLVAVVASRRPELLDEMAADPVVGLLLTLYDLLPRGGPSAAFVPLAQLEASAFAARIRREGTRPPGDTAAWQG